MNTPPLANIYLHLTEGCNLACRHCWLNPPFDPDGRHHACLPFDTIRQAVDEAKPLGLKALKLTGGEPLLHPRATDILALAADEGLSVVVETNGMLVDDAFVAALQHHGHVFVSVSLDSTRAEIHDAFRGVKGAFDRTVRGIRRLAEAGLQPQVIATLIPENRDEIPELVRFVQELGAETFKLNIVQPTKRGDRMQQRGYVVSLFDILAVCRDLAERVARQTSMKLYPEVPFAFRSLDSMHREQGGRCTVKNILGVLATGRYALCGIGASVEDLVFGEVGVDSLKQIWETHPVLKTIREDIPDRLTGICGRCLMKRICMGACVAQNYYRNRSLTAPHWFCEMAYEQGIFPSSRLLPERPLATAGSGRNAQSRIREPGRGPRRRSNAHDAK